ncbi:uncharacterized protein LOC118646659 [Monomorium pharaonis]|uniref:uncharacterized protein LOC118646658 n=1 Tax=Monomorium pharaonis TaxID=307658 RepID=UPI001745D176|nr:uncharacterized protein LOC118646658 [Monomorium pharaonis]XP_036146006.1 uncharacterized protein LOC118646659 [Monomorium pharaonis]
MVIILQGHTEGYDNNAQMVIILTKGKICIQIINCIPSLSLKDFATTEKIIPDYSPSEIIDIILILGECHLNYHEASRVYRDRYPERERHPNPALIRNLERRAREGDLKRKRKDHVYDENDNRVVTLLAAIHLNPHVSQRILARELGIPRSTIRRIMKKLKYHPYHITLTQALSQRDMQLRIQFCQWAQQMIRAEQNFFNFVMFSDESTFKNNGELNRHNCHYWSDVNPHWHRPIDNQNRWSINVWCGIVNGYLIGPYFFDGNVNGENFLAFLRDDLPQLLENVDLQTRQRLWIQLDGAPPHYTRYVRDYLNETYNDRWIGRGGPVAWPARSPDLTSPDFFLWGYLKNVVYEQTPTTRENMIERIREACRRITRDMLLKTVRHFQDRLALCIQANGDNFEQLIR